MFNSLYLSRGRVSCFDDVVTEPSAADNAAAEAAATAAAAAAAAAAGNEPKTFTQDQVNKIMAEDRRKHQAALIKTEATYKELLANSKSLTEKERQTLQENLDTVQGQLRTKEAQAAMEKKELEDSFSKKLTEAEKRAEKAEGRWRESTITRALQDAAVQNDAFRTDQIIVLLKQQTKLIEDTEPGTGRPNGNFKVMVEFPDVDPTTGETIMTTRTPADAVKRMKELPETYGNLFKSNIVSGIGANSTTAGLPAGANGKVDLKKLAKDPAAFRKALKENPSLFGLSKGIGR